MGYDVNGKDLLTIVWVTYRSEYIYHYQIKYFQRVWPFLIYIIYYILVKANFHSIVIIESV